MNTPAGQWSWWRNGQAVIVGWMPAEPFGDEHPICEVMDARDATMLVGMLTSLEAKPVLL